MIYRKHSVLDLVLFYGFYLEDVENVPYQFRIKIPRLWVYADIFRELSVNILINPRIDTSKSLEDHVERVLLERSIDPVEIKKTVADKIPFLSETLVANELYPELELKVMTKRISKADRKNDFHKNVKISKTGSFLVRPIAKSSIPDLITILKFNHRRCFIGWQMKNYQTTKLSKVLINEEINKFTDLLEIDACQRGVFVIILNGVGSEEVELSRGKVISSEVNNDLELNLPKNVEVFIPSRDQLNEYFGEEPLKQLSK